MDDLALSITIAYMVGYIVGITVYLIAGHIDDIVAAIRRRRARRTE